MNPPARAFLSPARWLAWLRARGRKTSFDRDGLLGMLVEALPMQVVLKDGQGRWLLANQMVLHGLGLQDRAWKGKTVEELAAENPDLAPLAKLEPALDDQSWAARQPSRYVRERIYLDHSPKHTEILMVPIFEENGDRRAMLVSSRDVSEQRKMDERYRSVIATVHEVIFLTDRLGRWEFLNPAWEEITGYSIAESLGRHHGEFVHPDDVERCRILSQAAIRDRVSALRIELRLRHRHEGHRWVEWVGHPTFAADGSLQEISGIIADVTERHEAQHALALREAEIRRTVEAERELVDLKADFIATVSHEFRTPLSAILSSAQILDRLGATLGADERQQNLDDIQAAVRRMADLLNDVLYISRIDSDPIAARERVIALEPLLEDVVRELRKSDAEAHPLTLTISGPLGEVSLDARLLRQVLTNLLSNALKYSPSGSPVSLEARVAEGELRLRVEDQGIGIPSDAISRLFTPFYRANNVGGIQGTGLGLAIVKRTVELLGGTLDVQSTLGKGTCFYLRLPTGT